MSQSIHRWSWPAAALAMLAMSAPADAACCSSDDNSLALKRSTHFVFALASAWNVFFKDALILADI